MCVVSLPNLLTLSRIPILFGVVGFLYLPFSGASSLAFVLFIIGALTDWADGYYARKQGLVSNFGKLMDALTDKVFMVGLFISLLVIDNILPKWTLPLLLLILSDRNPAVCANFSQLLFVETTRDELDWHRA